MAESGRRIATQVKSFLSPEKSEARLAEIADAQERFIAWEVGPDHAGTGTQKEETPARLGALVEVSTRGRSHRGC